MWEITTFPSLGTGLGPCHEASQGSVFFLCFGLLTPFALTPGLLTLLLTPAGGFADGIFPPNASRMPLCS